MRSPRVSRSLAAVAAGLVLLSACGTTTEDSASTAATAAPDQAPAAGPGTAATESPADATDAAASSADASTDTTAAAPADDAPPAETPVEDSAADDGSEAPAGTEAAAEGTEAPVTPAARSTLGPDGRVDLVGADVVPEAEVESNPLPSVVLDDVQGARKVNFRNLIPQDRPVLLWMWAPH